MGRGSHSDPARVPGIGFFHMVELTHPVPTLEWDTPLYHQARSQLEQALVQAEIPEWVAERLRYPERALILTLPVKLDDGAVRSFPAYRVQHSSVLGPTKGGVRYDAEVNLGECAALAMWMTWKCSLLRLPYGGAKGGVRCSPHELSQSELRRITRRFTADLAPFIGPDQDIPAPDMATNEQTMAWMMDTYSVQKGYAVPEIVTGKPVSIGGSCQGSRYISRYAPFKYGNSPGNPSPNKKRAISPGSSISGNASRGSFKPVGAVPILMLRLISFQ